MKNEPLSKSRPFSLQDIQPSLHKRDYLDQSVMEAELKTIWYAQWIYVCREEKFLSLVIIQLWVLVLNEKS